MGTVKIFELLKKRVLVTRESAKVIEPELRAALREGNGLVELDFAGVASLTPSFLDGILRLLDAALPEGGAQSPRLILRNPPTRVSSKFAAVGRSHNLAVRESPDGAWEIARESIIVARNG